MKRSSVRVLCLLCAVILLVGCGGGAPPMAAEAPAAPAEAAPPMADMAEMEPMEPGDWEMDWPVEDESFLPLPILTPSDERGRRMVYTVTMRLQTIEFMPGIRLLNNSVGELGGYLISADIFGRDMRSEPSMERSAHFIFRLPTEHLAEFIVVVENNYNILHLQQRTEDETARYQATAVDLDDLREEEAWLVERLEEETADGERVELEARLAEVRRSIRDRDMSQAALMDRVIYSTVEIELFEAFIPPADQAGPVTFGERVSLTVSNSVGTLGTFLQWFLVFAITVLPVLLLIAFCILVVVLVIRLVRRLFVKQEIVKHGGEEKKSDEEKRE